MAYLEITTCNEGIDWPVSSLFMSSKTKTLLGAILTSPYESGLVMLFLEHAVHNKMYQKHHECSEGLS